MEGEEKLWPVYQRLIQINLGQFFFIGNDTFLWPRLHRVRASRRSLGTKFMEPRRHRLAHPRGEYSSFDPVHPTASYAFSRPFSPVLPIPFRKGSPLSFHHPSTTLFVDNIICRGARTRAHGPTTAKMRCTDVSGQPGNRSAMVARVRRPEYG